MNLIMFSLNGMGEQIDITSKFCNKCLTLNNRPSLSDAVVRNPFLADRT